MTARLQATNLAIGNATRVGGRGSVGANLTAAEVTQIGEVARRELSEVPAGQVEEWKGLFQQRMQGLAGRRENAPVRGDIHTLLRGLGLPGLPGMEPQNGSTPWQRTGAQVPARAQGPGQISDVQAPGEPLPPRPLRMTGKMQLEVGPDGYTLQGWKMTMPDGKTVDLVASDKKVGSAQPMNPTWAKGFADDGIEMTVRGSLGADGKFRVEDYCPGKSDKYVYGRVQLKLDGQNIDRTHARAKEATVVVSGTRGDVEIKDKTLADKFRVAGPLGVILPGDPKMVNGKLVYEGAPPQYFSLGRPQFDEQPGQTQAAPAAAPDLSHVSADHPYIYKNAMAYHGYQGPMRVPDPNAAERALEQLALGRAAGQPDRHWALGDFELGTGDKANTLVAHNAVYISKPLGNVNAPAATGEAMKDADAAKSKQLQGIHQNVSPMVDLDAFNLRVKKH